MIFNVGNCFIQLNVFPLLLFKTILSTRRTSIEMV